MKRELQLLGNAILAALFIIPIFLLVTQDNSSLLYKLALAAWAIGSAGAYIVMLNHDEKKYSKNSKR